MRSRLLAAYVQLPEHPAKYRVVRWLTRWFPAEGVMMTVAGGIRMYLHPRDWIEYEILRGNPHEPATIDFLRRNLRAGDHALLAGVNNGMHVIAAAQSVGPTGCVAGVEPQPAALLRARKNIELNGVEGTVRLVAAALGTDVSLGSMPWSNPENSGAASLLDSGPGFAVPLVRLSDVIRTVCQGRLRLLLLDVQGYEVPALQGLDRDALPDLLVVEDGAEWLDKAGSSRRALYDLVSALGYELHDLFGNTVSPDGPPIHEENLVGVRPGVTVTFVCRS